MKSSLILTALVLLTGVWLVSCDKDADDLQQIGSRVEALEKKVLEANNALETLGEIITVIQQQGYVTKVTQNADGTTAITFSTGKTFTLRSGHQGVDGRDGREATLTLSVAQDPNDGQWYWTLGGEWLLTADGQRMRAGAYDGRNGQDGKSASETGATVPQVRINVTTRHWEISTDDGNTWQDTGVLADGKDGSNGANGQDGQDDLFVNITIAADGKSITFILRDGRTFRVPIG
jgi:hypothetical protein